VNSKMKKAIGFVKEPGVFVGDLKCLAVVRELGDDVPDVGLGDCRTDHGSMVICKVSGKSNWWIHLQLRDWASFLFFAAFVLSAPYFLPGKNPVCLKLLDKISIIFLVIFLDGFGNS
jgi:hypothetical protein